MSQKKRSGPTLNARLTRWESALAMVLLVDAFEERILFRYPELPPWATIRNPGSGRIATGGFVVA